MLRRPSLLLVLVLAACQPSPGAQAPTPSAGASGAPGVGASAAPAATVLHGTVRGLPAAVAGALKLTALLPTEPIVGANVSLGSAAAITGADGGFTLGVGPGGWLEAKYASGSKTVTLLGPAVDGVVIDPVSSLVVRKARYMLTVGAIAVLPPVAEVATVAAALAGAVGVEAAATEDARAAALLFDGAIARSQVASQVAGGMVWAVRTPAQQLSQPLTAGTAKVSTLAGGTNASTDGKAAQLLAPGGIARDAAGTVFVADTGGHLIRKVGPDGTITTLAGNGLPGFADGKGASAQFSSPAGLAVDVDGNLYVADRGNHAIRRVAPDGTVTTLAGTGTAGFLDAPAAAAAFRDPQGVGVAKDGTVYVADTGNHRVRKLAGGVVSTLAGTGTAGSADGAGGTLNGPRGVTVDGARVVVADTGNNRIRTVDANGTLATLAGNGAGNLDGLGTFAQFSQPSGVAPTGKGEILVADTGNGSIRRIAVGGAVTTLIQPGAKDQGTNGPSQPLGVAVLDDGTIYVADTGNHRVGVQRGSSFTTLAGIPGTSRRDGQGDRALFWKPRGVARDRDGNLYVSDAGNDVIRKITPAGAVSTFAGLGTGDADGPADIARFRGPAGLAFDPNGNLYVAETEGRRIRKIDLSKPTAPKVTTMAGDFNAKAEWLDGKGSSAHFDGPRGLAFGSDGKLYVADAGNHRIRTVAQDGVTTTYAGTDAAGTADGTLTSAIFDQPSGVAFGQDGTLYVTDARQHRLRKITRGGQVSTLAGHASGDADGQALEAAFTDPAGLAVDATGTIYVADAGNHRIRKITLDGAVTTVAGSGLAGWLDGTGLLARFDEPRDLVLGAKGELYVVDSATGRLRVVTP